MWTSWLIEALLNAGGCVDMVAFSPPVSLAVVLLSSFYR